MELTRIRAAVMARQGATIFGCDINLDAANKARDKINAEDEVKNHPAREQSGQAVDVFQESTVHS